MDLTSLDLSEKRVLRALFELARCDHPAHPDVLTRALDMDPSAVKRALSSLAARGLADGLRVRLTLSGLAVAVHAPPLDEDVLTAIGAPVTGAPDVAVPLWLRGEAER